MGAAGLLSSVVTPTADASIRDAKLTRLLEPQHPHGTLAGSGPVFLLKDTGQEGLLEARTRLAKFTVDIAETAFGSAGISYPAGSWIFPAQTGMASALRSVADDLGLDFVSASAPPTVPWHSAVVPRLRLWVPWADTDSIGWVRYSLDQRHIPYTYIRDEDIRDGKLKNIDVLL